MGIPKRALALLSACCLCFPGAAQAFVGVSPSTVEKSVVAGKRAKGVFYVTNHSEVPAWVQVDVKDWWKDQTQFDTPPLKKWFSIHPHTPFYLKPKRTKKVRFRIKAPKTHSGELAAMVFFSMDAAAKKGGPIQLRMRHGVPVYVGVAGTEKAVARLLDVAGHMAGDDSGMAIEFQVNIRNEGNIHLRPKGYLIVKREGKTIEEFDLEWGTPVYPGRSKIYKGHTELRSWPEGPYQAFLRVDYQDLAGDEFELKKNFSFTLNEDHEILIQ